MRRRFRLSRLFRTSAALGALVLAVLAAMLHPAHADVASEAVSWVAELNGPVNRDDHARAVRVDASGDVVAAG